MVSLLVGMLLAQPPAQTVVLCGDIMLNGISVELKPLEKLTPILKPAGVAIANLEIPLTDTTRQTPNKSAEAVRQRNQFVLKADPRHAPLIAATGIDLVSLGNNHCMDYREAGLNQMTSLLSKNSIDFAGAGANRAAAMAPVIHVSPDGRRIGLISALAFIGGGALASCTPARANSAGIGTLPFGGVIDRKAKTELWTMFQAAKAQCDLLIVGLHWGIERQTVPSSYQVTLGRACIDSGADIVWGHHPHVLQGAELYNGKPILYSMGNLVSSKAGATGALKVVYQGGQFSRVEFLPFSISGGRVQPVNGRPGQAAVKSFKGLCQLIQKRYPSKAARSLL